MAVIIRQARVQDLDQVYGLLSLLFDASNPQTLRAECQKSLAEPEAAFFLALEDSKALGVAHISIRHDYVEGASTDTACAYLEAIYVRPERRLQGLGGALVSGCRQWAVRQGCRQLASDALLDNEDSLHFHLKLGFREVARLIHFIETIEDPGPLIGA